MCIVDFEHISILLADAILTECLDHRDSFVSVDLCPIPDDIRILIFEAPVTLPLVANMGWCSEMDTLNLVSTIDKKGNYHDLSNPSWNTVEV